MSFPKGTRPEDTRAVDVEIDIDASVEDVWPYLSTSEGLSSWYVGVELSEQREGASATLNFGPGMVVPCRVAAYEHHDRVRLGPPDGVDSPRVEEYRVAAREGGVCTVRIVNWGFGEGANWDAEYDAVKKGWRLFLGVLKVVVERFRRYGAASRATLVSGSADPAEAWQKLTALLGGEAVGQAQPGDRLTLAPAEPVLTGVVDDVGERILGMTIDDGDGGLILRAAVEGAGPAMVSISFWTFGARKAQTQALEASWGASLAEAFPR